MDTNPLVDVLRSIVQSKAKIDGYEYVLTNYVCIPLPASMPPPPAEFRNEWFEIVKDVFGKWELRIAGQYAWDGCSHAADFVWPYNLPAALYMAGEGRLDDATAAASPLLGSVVHDPGYQFAEEIAFAWGWTIAAVLAWFDKALRAVMLVAGAAAAKAWRYYWGVRVFGRPYNWMGRHNVTLDPFNWLRRHNKGLRKPMNLKLPLIAVLLSTIILQGCVTHTRNVLIEERRERDEFDGGMIPRVVTDGDIIREKWTSYIPEIVVYVIVAVVGYQMYKDWKDGDEQVYVPNNTVNNYYPQAGEDAEAAADAAATP